MNFKALPFVLKILDNSGNGVRVANIGGSIGGTIWSIGSGGTILRHDSRSVGTDLTVVVCTAAHRIHGERVGVQLI